MSPNDVIWGGRPRWQRRELITRLERLLAGRVQRAYLIGSYARGEADSFSDIDLVIVADTARPWPERPRDFAFLWEELGSVDAAIYTPTEWEMLQREPSAFLTHARQSWVPLVEPAS